MVCQVDAKPAVYSVHWKKGNRFVATTFNHSLDKVSLDDDGIYVCSADNGLGQLGESQLQLDVLYEPVVTVEARREVEMGSSVAVPCNVSAKPSPAVIEWLKEGDDKFRVNGPVLRLNRVVATDTGRYTCRAINTIGGTERSSNATFQLMVRHEPGTAHITPEEPIAVDEASITLTCGADPPGWPAPQYRWWRAGAEATILAVSPEFTIPVARQNNEGTYYCQPSNVLGTGGSSSVKLRVFQAPRFISQLAPTKQMREGDSGLNVTCSAQGKPKPSITWLKDGVEIVPTSSNTYKLVTEESENSNAIFTVRSTLIFDGAERPSTTQLTAADRGVYTCAFENQVRRIESSLALKVERNYTFSKSFDKTHPRTPSHSYINQSRVREFQFNKFLLDVNRCSDCAGRSTESGLPLRIGCLCRLPGAGLPAPRIPVVVRRWSHSVGRQVRSQRNRGQQRCLPELPPHCRHQRSRLWRIHVQVVEPPRRECRALPAAGHQRPRSTHQLTTGNILDQP